MLSETHTQRILDLASRRGLLRASDLDAISSPRVILTRMTAAGLLERVGRGLYRLPGAQVGETVFVSTKDRKWSSSSLGMRPPEMSTPASMFFSMA